MMKRTISMKRITKLLFFFTLMYNVQAAFAMPVNDSSANLSQRSFPLSQMQEWRNSKDFIYQRNISASISVWDIIHDWINNLLAKILSTSTGRWSFWAIIFLVSAAIILYFIIRYQTKMNGMFSRKNEHSDFEEINEDIHSIDFPVQIANALDDNDYRLAIRLQYLYLLKFLSDKQMIHWYAGKTNDAYVHEIKIQYHEALYNAFQRISHLFDYVWYGATTVVKEDYDTCAELAQRTRNESKYQVNKKEIAS